MSKFKDHVTRNDVIIDVITKNNENTNIRETSKVIYHSKGLEESDPEKQVLSNLSNFVKRYGHLSEILAFLQKHSPNMVESRDSWC